jgi:5'-3' exonuclease
MKKRLAYDMSSFMWTMLSWGKDKENGYTVQHEGKDVYINSALYGYDNTLGRMLDVLKQFKLNPINCILVFEGANSKSRRLLIDNSYKGGGASSRPPEAYEEFTKLREMLKQTWKDLGAQTMWQDAAEGDDTLAWLAHNTEDDLVIATFDNDLTVLNMVNQYGAKVETWINEMIGFNKYGPFDYDLVTTYKALVGDSSDKIKGCPGFGPAKWEALRAQYGDDGVREIHNMLLGSNLKQLGDFIAGPQDKLLQLVYDNAPQVQTCFDLARIRPEWVNTMRMPLHWEPGMVRQRSDADRDPRLKQWLGQTWLVTAENFDEATAWALPRLLASEDIALDIETSTPDESDDWLAAMTKSGDLEDAGVDVFGSYLVGLGLTFGPNNQYTFYFSVKHADTDNVDSEKLRQFIAAIPQEKELIIQNVSFELSVLFNEWGGRQLDNGYHGFLPNVRDTAIEASYVNENSRRGLKERSHGILGYRQQTFDEVTRVTAHPSELFPGGRVLSETYETRQVGTGRFEPLSEEEIAAGVQPAEIMKTEYVLEPTGRTLVSRVDPATGEHLEFVYATGEEIDERDDLDPNTTEMETRRIVKTQTRRYKMHELPAWHVLGYGADDPICTIALHNYYKLHMQLEHHYEVYQPVELNAAYQHAKNFIDGCDISLEKMNELSAEDDETYDKAWATLRDYLIEKGWEGTRPPEYTVDITPAQVKEAFTIVTGRTLGTQMRTLSKIVTFIREVEDEPVFAGMLDTLVQAQPLLEALRKSLTEEDPELVNTDEPFDPWALTEQQKADQAAILVAQNDFNAYVRRFFKGEPQFNDGSPKQMQRLMYEVMGLPIVVRNKPTEVMRKAGIREGTPKTDSLAIAYALQQMEARIKEAQEFIDDGLDGLGAWAPQRDEAQQVKSVLEALQLMSMVGTRRTLFYNKYPYFPHWKDGKVRSQHNQASTNTRRASESSPNKQQWPKHPKIDGYASRFREVVVPHRPDAVIVSIDFKAQELRLMAEQSQDPVMLSMYIGDNKRDQHHLTGLAIIQKKQPERGWLYEPFADILDDPTHPDYKFVKKIRNLGKKLNFTAEFGAMAEKVAITLMVSVEEAQEYLDAREELFAVSTQWKENVKAEAKQSGYVTTMLGARRHLGPAFMSDDKWEASKAERQAVNFKIQGSAAEQTKLAEGRMWERGLFFRYDAVCIGPIHDEIVASVRIADLFDFIPEMHACMVANYAGMAVPIEGDISFGLDFFNQIEIGPVPSREAIQKGLDEMWKNKAKREAQKEAA